MLGLGGINPKQIEGMMKKMGINQQKFSAKRVIIELVDKNIIIDEPDVSRINMSGNESWQIVGNSREEEKEGFSADDVAIVMEKTSKSKDEVTRMLKKNKGDIALSILELNQE